MSEQHNEEMLVCMRCKQELPIGEFGISRTRANGRNVYCRECAVLQVREYRLRLKEKKAARVRRCAASMVDEIERFIRTTRICTYREVEREFLAISSKEEIGLCIAALLLNAGAITSTVIGDVRYYLPTEKPVESAPRHERPRAFESGSSAFMQFNMPVSNFARREKPHGSV